MATKEKHRQRSHRSYHTSVIPKGMFQKNAFRNEDIQFGKKSIAEFLAMLLGHIRKNKKGE